MQELIGLALLAGLFWWSYKSGKRNGSRKGFRAGRKYRRNRQRRR